MGNIFFMDLRMVADADGSINSGAAGGAAAAGDGSTSSSVAEQLSCSIVKTVEAHSKGGMSVLTAHPTAPLLATGTTSQVVKVWTDAGDVVSGFLIMQLLCLCG
jgi:regulator-associated protein of mTOR